MSSDDATVASLMSSWFHLGAHLSVEQRERLVDDTTRLVDELRWESARGFETLDHMRVAIAAHAALLTLELPDGLANYRRVTSVIVHPRAMVRSGARASSLDGLDTDGETRIVGEAHSKGPVLISWSEVQRQVRLRNRGGNVIVHEFAHRLDMLDGAQDGVPAHLDPRLRHAWADVTGRVFDRMQTERHPVLDSYAATNPAEFFSVASETFFVRPVALRDSEPGLYRALSVCYRQDPARARRNG
jgi:MtfA peptidase